MSGLFTGIAPTRRVECDNCGGTGRVIASQGPGGQRHPKMRKCSVCYGECYTDVDLTTDERLERIEDHLGIGLLL